MRAALIIGFLVVVPLVLVGFGLRYVGDLDVVTREYDTYEAADRVFTGGWLPVFIPVSATGIVTRNDLDLNTSNGEFHYDPVDTDAFLANLRPLQDQDNPAKEYHARSGEMISGSYRPFEYRNVGSIWVFFVDGQAGHVIYDMQPARWSSAGD
jgi:hypothetical protein